MKKRNKLELDKDNSVEIVKLSISIGECEEGIGMQSRGRVSSKLPKHIDTQIRKHFNEICKLVEKGVKENFEEEEPSVKVELEKLLEMIKKELEK